MSFAPDLILATNVIAFRSQSAQPSLRRPRILIRAAREGQTGWKRDRDLARLLRCETCPRPGAALPRLRAEEEVQDNLRRARAAEYDMHRHVRLMIAILGEMRAAVAAIPGPQAVAMPRAAGCGTHGFATDLACFSVPGTTIPAHL